MKITDDYLNKGIGVCCFRKNEIVGICSSNIIYKRWNRNKYKSKTSI